MVTIFIISLAFTIFFWAVAIWGSLNNMNANNEFINAAIGTFATLIIAAIKIAN